MKQIRFYFYISTYRTGDTIRMRVDQTTANWGTTLDATEADFMSTSTTLIEDKLINSTGWKYFTIPEGILDWTKYLWIRLSSTSEGAQDRRSITLYSQNNATNKPYLQIIDLGTDQTVYGIRRRQSYNC